MTSWPTSASHLGICCPLFATLLIVFCYRFEQPDTEENSGGESVSQSLLKDKAFSTLLDQNPPFEQRPENGVSPPTKACNAAFRDWWRRRLRAWAANVSNATAIRRTWAL